MYSEYSGYTSFSPHLDSTKTVQSASLSTTEVSEKSNCVFSEFERYFLRPDERPFVSAAKTVTVNTETATITDINAAKNSLVFLFIVKTPL